MRCPDCNALNSDDADWCSLCLRRLKDPPKPQVAQPVMPTEEARQTAPGGIDSPLSESEADERKRQADLADLFMHQSPATSQKPSAVAAVTSEGDVIRKTGDAITWSCPSCGQANPIARETCGVCSTPFFDAFREEKKSKISQGKSSTVAAALSIFPGAGHFYLGLVGDGVGRAALGLWWFGTGLALSGAIPTLLMVKVFFLLASLLLVAGSAGDAYRAVEAPNSPKLLSRRVLLYTSLGLLTLLVLGTITSALAART